MDVLSELERALAPFKGSKTLAPDRPSQNYNHKPNLSPSSLALVPYVASAPVNAVHVAEQQERRQLSNTRVGKLLNGVYRSSAWRGYMYLGWVCFQVMMCARVTSAYLLYLTFALVYVAAHPELLIRAVLNALKASPRLVSAYLDVLGEAAWLEFKTAFSPF